MNVNFKFPNTKTCNVLWHRNGQLNEVTIPTPTGMEGLKNTMIMKHRVGLNEIRAVKADPNGVLANTQSLNPTALANAMMGLR